MTARIAGQAAARGLASGPAWRHRRGDGVLDALPSAPDPTRTGSAEAAIRERPGQPTIVEAMRVAAAGLDDLATRLAAAGRDDEAAILGAQALIATDPALRDAAERRAAAGTDHAAAVRQAGGEIAARIEASGDSLVAARGADVRDVAERIARIVEGGTARAPERPSILVADDLPPSLLAELPASLVLGVATEAGSPTAHAAIFARGRGIPMVVGATGILAALEVASRDVGAAFAVSGHPWILVDGDAGTVVVAASEEELAPGAGAAVDARDETRPTAGTTPDDGGEMSPGPCTTADGHRVRLVANIEHAADADRAIAAGAEGVGLFRTEALFLGRSSPPSERAQREVYRRVLEVFGRDRPVAIRLADIGGDKAVAYVAGPAEANPFLGVRGIRLARRDRRLFLVQLRAIAGAAADAGVEPRVLAPMIATLADAELVLGLRDEAMATLGGTGAVPPRMRLGAMIEVPSAALIADLLARRMDFLSIGTNDLTQYTLAADRGNAALAAMQDALHPAVLRLVRLAVEGAAGAGRPVAVCGEVAGDPDGALVLVGLGIDELSVEPGSIGVVRAALAGVDLGDLRALAEAALCAPDAAAVRAMAADLRGVPRPAG